VKVVIAPPTSLSETERQLYEQLQAARSYNPRQSLVQTKL